MTGLNEAAGAAPTAWAQSKQQRELDYQRSQNCEKWKPAGPSLKEDQESLHFFESMASFSFMLGC